VNVVGGRLGSIRANPHSSVKTALKALLRRSAFAKGVVTALRGVWLDCHVLIWSTTRNRTIERYLQTAETTKLHLGASHNRLEGWLNSDVAPGSGMIYLDVTRRFPFADDTIDYVFAEHLIEHVDHEDALTMLREAWRVLKPGGKIRIATPDLGVIVQLHGADRTEAQKDYVDWIVARCMPFVDRCKEVFVINNAFHAWGHRFLYDRELLALTLSRLGFTDLTFCKPGDSSDPQLRALEAHGREIQNEEINHFETFVVEARALKH